MARLLIYRLHHLLYIFSDAVWLTQ